MIEYFYTLDLGKTYGPKLEKMAAQASFEDVEAFAAMALCHALDLMEAREQADNAYEALRDLGGEKTVPDGDFNDGIPF
ncbi:hypothetical protein [Microbaculum marinisediminis]|uniref:Uncharacterized protein n=1 Tax=Microbaculum marinisediminis TaxID=2931392 RepID=A0AAW5QWG8_9HYPH|nr:hypothetical protein [Microbaculum sp. A6E488]MCT8970801.1 hypothetical protein [Microbaculum sp. A6E488]